MGSARTCSTVSRQRKLTCAASETTHEKISPENAAPIMYRNACFGAQFSMTSALTIPYEDTSSASRGEPAALSLPIAFGAHPDRPMENNSREAT